jgi:hypothetical protein
MAIWPIGKARVRVKLRRRQKRRNGITTTLLKNVDYNHKIGSILEGTTNRRLVMEPREMVESKTTSLLKRSQHFQMNFANDYVLRVQDLRGYIDTQRFIKRGSL